MMLKMTTFVIKIVVNKLIPYNSKGHAWNPMFQLTSN